MIRNILGVIVGYAFFVFTSLAYFKLSGRDPHADPSIMFAIITAIYGIICSFVSGLIAKAISLSGTLMINYILAFIIAGFAAFSFFKSEGNHWTQILAILVCASFGCGWILHAFQKPETRKSEDRKKRED